MSYMEETQNKIERRFLSMFTVISLFVAYYIVINSNYNFLLIPEFVGIILGTFFFLREVFQFKTRMIFLLVCMVLEFLSFGIITKNFYSIIVVYVFMILLISLLEIKGCSYALSVSMLLVIGYHVFVKRSLDFNFYKDVTKVVMSVLVMFATEVLIAWRMQMERDRRVELEQVIKGLKEAEQSKDEFMANVSHEIRTPLNTVSGMSELLLSKDLDETVTESVFHIKMAGKRLQNLISDILDYSELQSGKIELVENQYNFSSGINDVVTMITAEYEGKNIEFIIDCDARIPALMIGDLEKIKRVMYCLLDNAFKFTETGYVYLGVTARAESYGVNIIITVKDSGIGMSEESLEKLSEKYNQADMKKNRNQEGAGLGLTIAREMISLMNGFLHVESTLHEGSEFTVMIPQKVVDEKPITSVEGIENKHLAVYVDSEKYDQSGTLPTYLKTYDHMASSLGATYTRCETMAKLKAGIKRGRFTHIFMSVQEYEKNIEFFDDISKTIPVILVMENEKQNIGSDACYFIYKPFSVFHVAAALNGERTMKRLHGTSSDRFVAPTAKILAVDDNRMNLKVLEGLLREYQIKISKAGGGEEALSKIEDMEYDLIFMDHMMPGMDGIEAFHQIRNRGGHYQNVPIIAFTANAVNGAREMFLNEGFQEYIAKPIDPAHLRYILKTFLRDKITAVEEQAVDNVEVKEAKVQEPGPEIAENMVQTKEAIHDVTSEAKADAVLEVASEEQILDEKVGLQYCGDMEDMYLEFLDYYLENSKDTIAALKKAYDENDAELYRTKIHSLKSTSLQIGAVTLSEMAKASEMACKNGDFETARGAHEEIMAKYEKVAKAIANKLG